LSAPRTFPHNLDAEASVLGGIFLRRSVLADLTELEPGDFYDHRHKCVFAAMRNLEAAEKPIDPVTVENELSRLGQFEAIGGSAFLGELILRVPTADNARVYADIVRDKHQARKLMVAASDIVERGYDDELPLVEYLDESEARILEATARRSKADDVKNIAEVLIQRFQEYDAICKARVDGGIHMTGCPTGVAGLDALLGGWQFGIVSTVAGRPAMGKTSTAIASAIATAQADYGVHVFSLEEPNAMYADRSISRESGVPAEAIRGGRLNSGQMDPIVRAAAKLRKLRNRWLIDDRGGVTAREIVRSVRRHRSRNRTRLVIVDHLQIVGRSKGLDENAALEEIINMFAAAAKDRGENGELIAWLVLCQLNRKVEERTDKRPLLSDLRGSGAIEQSTRVVVMQYRGSYYGGEPQRDIDYDCDCRPEPGHGRNAKPVWPQCDHRPSQDKFERQVQLIIAKNNNGPTGHVFAEWDGPTMTVK
jgi:replicative DNA helicase